MAGNTPLVNIWEAVWDKNPMAPPVFLHISADEVVDGVGLASEAIDPTVVLECCPSNRTGVFVPPRFLWNEVCRLVWPPPSSPRMAMDSVALVEAAPPKFHVVEAEGGEVGRWGFGCDPCRWTRGCWSTANR